MAVILPKESATLLGTQNADNVAITGGTIDGVTLGATTPAASTFTNVTLTGLLYESAATGIIAGTTRTQAGATALTKEVNRIDTSTVPAAGSTLGDGVVLPASVGGLDITVINNTANPITVYGAGTDTINGITGATGVPVPPNCVEMFECAIAGSWFYDAGVGFSGALNTVLSNSGITAFAGGGQTSAILLTADINQVATVATAGDSVKLPASAPGLDIYIINHGANDLGVFGSGADTIDDVASATGVRQMPGSLTLYSCAATGKWYSNGIGTGYSGSLPTVSFGDAISAAGTTQATATPLTRMINRVTTVAASSGVNLPSSGGGLSITVINQGANPLTVYPAQGSADTINGIAAATGVIVMVGSTVVFESTVAGTWIANGLGNGFNGNFPTTSSSDNLTAVNPGAQGTALLLTTVINRVVTVAAAGSGVKLPLAVPGLQITVINANALNAVGVYPSTGDQINALGANNPFSLAATKTATFYSTVAGQWHSVLSA